jgi:hypothetical protein
MAGWREPKTSDPKVETTFGIHPMFRLWAGASFERKTGPTFPHDALSRSQQQHHARAAQKAALRFFAFVPM